MTILRDISVIWAMINIAIFFLIMMEFRIRLKRLIIYSILYLVPLVTFNIWFLTTYGAAKMAQWIFLIMLLPTVCFYFFMSKYRDGRFLYTFFLICDLNADLTIITYILDLLLPGPQYLWMFILRLILFPLLNFSAYKWLRSPYLMTQHSVEKGWYAFAIAAALFELLTLQLFSRPNMIENRPADLINLIIVIALTLLTNWYIFIALLNQHKIYEMNEREQLLRVQTKQLKERIDAIEHISSTDNILADTEHKIWCENTVLNAVFTYYFANAKANNIDIEAEIDIPDNISVDATELSTVFANALENAFNALMLVPEEERIIKCRCIRYPALMFRISNPYNGEIRWSEDKLPQPKDKLMGTGSRSIAAYCDKHGAWCNYETKDGWFTMQLTQP